MRLQASQLYQRRLGVRTSTRRRIAWLHDFIDDFEPLFEVGKGALHRVDGDPLEVIEGPTEGVGALGELAGH